MAKLKKPSPKNLGAQQQQVQQKPKKGFKNSKNPGWTNKSEELDNAEASDGDTAEAIDIDVAEDSQVDAQEISDFVKKLGLDKYTDSFLASDSSSNLENQNKKKEKKKVKKSLNLQEKEEEKLDLETKKASKLPPKGKPSKKLESSTVNETPATSSNETSHGGKAKPAEVQKRKKKNKSGKMGQKDSVAPNQQQQGQKMIIKPGGKWFEDELQLDDKTSLKNEQESEKEVKPKALSKDQIAALQKTASGLLDADIQAYRAANRKGGKKSDYEWMEKIMKSGTLPDRMAAFIVRIQDSPIHSLNYLQHLISMVKVQGKEQCMMTADTVRDLFLEDLLPPNRKLIPFENRALQLHDASKKQLIQWIFEDRLKAMYHNYIEALKRMGGDTVEKLRGKSISIVYQLLVAHPEQENTLLQSLVNKLGDPSKKMGSRALFYLKKLLYEHPKMKMIVIAEVERLLFRNNIAKRAQYYGICFMNLINLTGEHASLAHKLITVYLAFFKACIKTGDIDTKMMSGLLTGINRAFPQAKEYGFQFTESLDTLYKIVQLSQFAIGVQALSILFQITDVEANPAAADRVLYQKLLDAEFVTTSHSMQFLNLIFKAMKTDNSVNRVSGFIKRLLQICQNVPANLACAILFLVSEVSKVHPGSLIIGGLSSSEIEEIERTKEEVLEASDNEENGNEEDGSASAKKKLGRSVDMDALMKSTNLRIAPDEERYPKTPLNSKTVGEGIHKPSMDVEIIKEVVSEQKKTQDDASLSTDECQTSDVKPDVKPILTEYNAQARNPSYCGAEFSLAYELTALTKHFHPSVALFAQTLAARKKIHYDGNPLKDFMMTRFLERFVYRNPKAKKDRPEYEPEGLRNVPVNSETYLGAEEDKIPEEERFFYKFFKTKKEEVDSKPEKEDISDTESVGDEEFDDLMSNYFKSVTGDAEESDDDDIEESNIDFAAGVSMQTTKSKKRKHEEDSEEDEQDDEEDDSGADDDADDFIDMDDGELSLEEGSEDEVGFLDDDEDEIMPPTKSKKGSRKAFAKGSKGLDMFAPAEEFAEMLEENADEGITGSQTLINKDRADPKQLKWEIQKDRWVKGYAGNSKARYKGSNKKKPRRK